MRTEQIERRGRGAARRWSSAAVLSGALLVLGSACTVVSVRSQETPAGVRANGVIDGHAVVGWRPENKALRLDLFDGTSRGAIFELVLWRLARVELGVAGFGVGVGPFDVALGVLAYDPHMPIPATPKPVPASKTGAPTQDAGAPQPCNQPGCAGSEHAADLEPSAPSPLVEAPGSS